MKALSHRESEDASGDMADRRSREGPGRRKEQTVAVVRTEKANRGFRAVCMLFDTIKGTFIFIF